MSDQDTTTTALQNLAVLQVAPALGANTAELLDSRAFRTVLGTLDPAAPDYGQRVGNAINAAIQGDPARFKTPAGPAPREQQVSKNSGSAAKQGRGAADPDQPARQWTDADVDASSPTELTKAMGDGLLVDLGFPAPRVRR